MGRKDPMHLDCRFVLCLLASMCRLDGTERVRERPSFELVTLTKSNGYMEWVL